MPHNFPIRLLAMMVTLSVATASASADVTELFREMFASASRAPHPAIVQVLAPDQEAIARGSGTLIHVDGQFGYVITNWHVVRDAEREVLVIFPDGYQSLARILKMNKDWDLALLLIWAGAEQPMPLATVGPRPGDELQIAGYGAGDFRVQRGDFSTYAAPQPDMPFEMFEVKATARQGDSGGPIINQRGELVGVLFGAGDGRTTGTQVGRVRMFVNEAFEDLRERVENLAEQPADAGPRLAQMSAPPASIDRENPGAGGPLSPGFGESPGSTWASNSNLAATPPVPAATADSVSQSNTQKPVSGTGGWHAELPHGNAQPAASPSDVARPSQPTSHNVAAWRAYQHADQDALATADNPHQETSDNALAMPESGSVPAPELAAGEADYGTVDQARAPAHVEEPRDLDGSGDQVATNRMSRPAEISRRDLTPREVPFQANRGAWTDGPTTAAIGPEHNMAADPPSSVPTSVPPTSVPFSGGVTWDQLRSFFAAVGVFAVLHAIVKAFSLTPTTKSRR